MNILKTIYNQSKQDWSFVLKFIIILLLTTAMTVILFPLFLIQRFPPKNADENVFNSVENIVMDLNKKNSLKKWLFFYEWEWKHMLIFYLPPTILLSFLLVVFG